MNPIQRELARRLANTQPSVYTERYATVISWNGTIATVRMSGDPTDLPGMRAAYGTSVGTGATVIIKIKGSDAYISGRLG